jgi:hypothetical protein
MREDIRNLIDAIQDQRAVDAEQAFNNIVLQKAGEAMDVMRVDVASTMFTSKETAE